jgi:hypothetical protein
MKKVKEIAQKRSKPIWKHYTADQPAKTTVNWRVPTRKHALPKRMSNNPLTSIFARTKTSRSTSKARPLIQTKSKTNNMLTNMFISLGKRRSTSREQPVLEVEDQCIDDRFGDVPT